MKSKKILIIIPAYNEAKNILNVYTSINSFKKNKNMNCDIIIINDGSLDDTGIICENNGIPNINLLTNLGIGGAVQTGYKYALENNYDIAIQFDGDGQHDVNYINALIEPILMNDADMVIGSRFISKDKNNFQSTFSRRMGIKVISFFTSLLTKQKLYDTTSGFRAVNREIIKIFADRYPIEYPEPVTNVFILKQNFKVKEIFVKMNPRTAGESSIKSWKNFYYMINVLLSMIVICFRGDR